MKKIFITAFFLSIFCQLKAQTVDNAYSIYQDNLESIWGNRPSRGGNNQLQALKLLTAYKTNTVASTGGFAEDLSRLYSAKGNIGLLFFSFKNDTLTRQFYEPGKLIEEKKIAIAKSELLNLPNQLNKALNLYQLTSNTKAQKRGGEGEVVIEPNGKKTDLKTCITELTNLLIPKSFNEKYKHLIVIPCLSIGNIPFQILKPFKNDSYLIDKCSITTAPNLIDFIGLRSKLLADHLASGSVYLENLDNLEESEQLNSIKWTFENPLFISNPTYPRNEKYFFPNLPGTEKEIQTALSYVKKYKLLKNDSATKSNVLENLGTADMVYFATHGVSDTVDPLKNNFLVLSGPDPYLTSREIMDLRKNRNYKAPEMVILSACQTGLGKTLEGGVMGSLSRSFLLSGSSFVLESLWSVDDEATAYLMSRFMVHIQTPSQFFPAEPLRKAIVDTKKKYDNPVLWAGFSLIGTNF
jgi:CHAT domain-containing protein